MYSYWDYTFANSEIIRTYIFQKQYIWLLLKFLNKYSTFTLTFQPINIDNIVFLSKEIWW